MEELSIEDSGSRSGRVEPQALAECSGSRKDGMSTGLSYIARECESPGATERLKGKR